MSNKKKFDFDDNFKKMFSSTTLSPNNQNISNGITNIAINQLVPFKNHPFKLYEGERFTDMVESVKENGVIIPIIVRPLDDGIYEILSGHNRVEAAKSAEFETIPGIIREDLNDDEALLIVTETNLIQRSFVDLSHSERAAALAVHNNALKNQGKRTDLIKEIENLLKNSENISNNADFETYSPMVNKLNSHEKTAQSYGLNRGTVARYLRVNKLIGELKNRVDNEEISIRAAVELSYISIKEQSDLFKILNENEEFKIDIKKSELLREYSNNKNLTSKIIRDILSGTPLKKRNRASLPVQSIKIKGKVLSEYFQPEQKPDEIEAEIIEAIKFYRAHKDKF
jgi:ParB family chromosome partitioning protein